MIKTTLNNKEPGELGLKMPLPNHNSDLREAQMRLQAWLFDEALPLWQAVSERPVAGSFAESVDISTKTATAADRRLRVQARQVYAFVESGRIGWQGPWEGIAQRGLTSLFDTYALPGGLLASKSTPNGHLTDPTIDLYDHAFVLFALAHMAAAFPQDRDHHLERARAILDSLTARHKHQLGGFYEASPQEPYLRANPHMHMLEAALELELVDTDCRWHALSDEIVRLALERFINPCDGSLSEFFDRAWCPAAIPEDRVVEPGHQFEWSWLLLKWSLRRGSKSVTQLARRLYDIGKTHGVDAQRGVAVLALDGNFNVTNPIARLWGQTEWLKAALILARLADTENEQAAFVADAIVAIEALERFFEGVPPGLWRDKLNFDGSFVEEPAPASSLYHIVCAISELCAFNAQDADEQAG